MMLRLLTLLVVVLGLLCTVANGQVRFTAASVDELRTTVEVPRNAQPLRIPRTIVEQLRREGTQQIIVPTREGTLRIVGQRFEMFSPEAVFVEAGDGEKVHPLPEHVLLRGRVEGEPGSTVFMACFPTHVVALIERRGPDGPARWMIAPDTVMPGRMAGHVYFQVRDGAGSPRKCIAETLPDYQRRVDSIFATLPPQPVRAEKSDAPQSAVQYALQLALDCTFSFYKNLGSDLGISAASAITIAGACAVVYERDANVLIRVPYLRVFTSDDPYPGDIGAKLGRVREHWEANMQHVNRSVTCLLSGEGGGGLAWVGVLCSGYGYNVSGVDGKVNFPADGYIWDVDVVSHELGHNVGSPHTHNCGWNPPIDSCWDAEGGCYQWRKVQRGTIMSYCHLQWKGTELAIHPRVASLFARALSTAPCSAPVPNPQDTDIAVVAIEVPANGATVAAGTAFVPVAHVRNVGVSAAANVRVLVQITNLNNNTIAERETTIATLAAGETQRVQLPPLTLVDRGDMLIRVSVTAAGDAHLTNNTLTRPFAVGSPPSGTIRVLGPNGGETLIAGESASITFTAAGVATSQVTLSTDGGATWSNVRAIAEGQAPVAWKVPYTPSTQCIIRVASLSNPQAFDVSDAVFTIRAGKDAQAFEIRTPVMNELTTTPVAPLGVVRNVGRDTLYNVDVQLSMRWVRSTEPSYNERVTVGIIPPGLTVNVPFPSTPKLANGVHVATLTVLAPLDSNASNNTFSREFTSAGVSPPTDLRWESGPNRILLQWNVNDETDGNRTEVWRETTGGVAQRIARLRSTVTSFVDTSAIDGVEYSYRLRTIQGSDSSVFTAPRTATPKTYPLGAKLTRALAVSPPVGAGAVPTPVDLVWTEVEGADQYEVQVSHDVNFTDLDRVYIVRDAGQIMVPVPFESQRYWRVRAMNQTHTGVWSAWPRFSTTKACSGSALSFNGVNQNATDTSVRWTGGAITVEYWTYVRRAGLRSSTTFMVGATDNTSNRLQAHVPWEDGVMYWDYGDLNNGGRITASFNPYFDSWVHVAFVSNGSTWKAIYVNGNLVASENSASAPSDLSILTLGSMRGYLYFNGGVDEFRIWNVARTEEEIRSTMNRRDVPATENAKVIGVWRFSEGAGTTTRDQVRSRTLTLSSADMWQASGALVGCDDVGVLPQPALDKSILVLPRNHRNRVEWQPVTAPRGAVWYEVQVLDPATNAVIVQKNNVVGTQSAIHTEFPGLPADSTMTLRVRARTAYATSPWATRSVTTLAPCPSYAVHFKGGGQRLLAQDVLFSGRAVTVEYWSNVATAEVAQTVSFMVGTREGTNNRLQAHAPWDDRTLYWDYGDWMESGRTQTTYEPALDRWTHIALTSNGHDSMAIYLNGVLVRRSSFASAPGDLQELVIGGDPYAQRYHRGSMRDFRLWNVMRSEQQIRSTMYERVAAPRSHLLGSWLLDEGEGLRAADATLRTGWARSATEVPWEETTQKLMHAPAILYGARVAIRADTASYILRNTPGCTATWSITNGVVEDSADGAVTIRWNESAIQGTITVSRLWTGGCTDQTDIDVSLLLGGMSVGEQQTILANQLQVWPNPADDVLHISLGDMPYDVDLELRDVQGRLQYRSTMRGETTVAVSALASGVYTLQFRLGSAISATSVVVRR